MNKTLAIIHAYCCQRLGLTQWHEGTKAILSEVIPKSVKHGTRWCSCLRRTIWRGKPFQLLWGLRKPNCMPYLGMLLLTALASLLGFVYPSNKQLPCLTPELRV